MARAAKPQLAETAQEFLAVYRDMYGAVELPAAAKKAIYGEAVVEASTLADLNDLDLLQYCVFDLLGRERQLLEACSAMNEELETLRKRNKRTTAKKR